MVQVFGQSALVLPRETQKVLYKFESIRTGVVEASVLLGRDEDSSFIFSGFAGETTASSGDIGNQIPFGAASYHRRRDIKKKY